MPNTLDLHERPVQNDIIQLLRSELGYRYLGNLDIEVQRFDAAGKITSKLVDKTTKVDNSNLRSSDMLAFLKKHGWNESQSTQAYMTLKQAAECHQWSDLYDANHRVWDLLTSFTTVRPQPGRIERTLDYIDWNDPYNNDWAVAEEVSVLREGSREDTRRPDIVIYLNGIAIAILELKRAAISVAEGIRQNYRNQQDGQIPAFFSTVQLVLAGNPSEGLYYGTIKTPEKYFVRWKEPAGHSPNEKDYISQFIAVPLKSNNVL